MTTASDSNEARFKDAMKAFTKAVGDLAKSIGTEVNQSKPEVAKGLADQLRQAASKLDTFRDSAAEARSATSQRAQQTRQQLLAAAAQVFAAKGFEGASMDDVAKAAGFTKGAVYAHFSSKFELIVALTEQVSAAQQPLPEVGHLPRLLGQASAGSPGEDLSLTLEIMSLAVRSDSFRQRVLPTLSQSANQVARQVAANRGAQDADGQPLVDQSDYEAAIALTGLIAGVKAAALFNPDLEAGSMVERLAAQLLAQPAEPPPAAPPVSEAKATKKRRK
ncbi:MAG: TetR family transcriptional regulator [Micrococcales bacterium]|nr:TetR family transcriptional regulator [Micrococcales bacterium]